MRMLPLALGATIAVLPLAPLPLAAQQAAPQRQEAAKVDPALEAAQKAFDALPEAERKAIQDDLIWGSTFNATVSGSFAPRTYESIRSFERVLKAQPDGILTEAERKALAEAARKARAAVKFEMVTDKPTGAMLGLPLGLLPKRETLPIGSMWSSKDDALLIRTGLFPGGAQEMPGAFEATLNLQAPGRKVTYKLLRPDFFVVSGEVGPRTFYTRTGIGRGHLSSYTITYPTARAKDYERVMIALANNFHPIATQQTPSNTGPAPSASTVAPGGAPQAGMLAPGLVLTGLVTGPGKVLTGALAAACPDLRVNGKSARVSGGSGPLRLLEADTGRATPAVLAAATKAESAVLIGYALSGGKPALSVVSGTLAADTPGRIEAPLHAEGGGSLAFDRMGNLIGLVQSPKQAPRLVAGIVPAVGHMLTQASDVLAAAGATGTAAGSTPMSVGAIAARIGPSLLAIECGQPVALPK